MSAGATGDLDDYLNDLDCAGSSVTCSPRSRHPRPSWRGCVADGRFNESPAVENLGPSPATRTRGACACIRLRAAYDPPPAV